MSLAAPGFPEVPLPPTPSTLEWRCLALLASEALASHCGGGEPGATGLAAPPSPRAAEDLLTRLGLWESEHRASGTLASRTGVFVTLFRSGELRGCLGTTEGKEPLYLAVPRLACAAASRDGRFERVAAAEFPQLEAEITLLGSMVLLPKEPEVLLSGLNPRIHGVSLRLPGKRGLLLPQVARRLQWSAQELLEQVAVKAGCPSGAWREASAAILTFTTCEFDVGNVCSFLASEANARKAAAQ